VSSKGRGLMEILSVVLNLKMKKANKAESEILDQRKIKQETVKHEPVQD
jgi:hypothetical protein